MVGKHPPPSLPFNFLICHGSLTGIVSAAIESVNQEMPYVVSANCIEWSLWSQITCQSGGIQYHIIGSAVF